MCHYHTIFQPRFQLRATPQEPAVLAQFQMGNRIAGTFPYMFSHPGFGHIETGRELRRVKDLKLHPPGFIQPAFTLTNSMVHFFLLTALDLKEPSQPCSRAAGFPNRDGRFCLPRHLL